MERLIRSLLVSFTTHLLRLEVQKSSEVELWGKHGQSSHCYLGAR